MVNFLLTEVVHVNWACPFLNSLGDWMLADPVCSYHQHCCSLSYPHYHTCCAQFHWHLLYPFVTAFLCLLFVCMLCAHYCVSTPVVCLHLVCPFRCFYAHCLSALFVLIAAFLCHCLSQHSLCPLPVPVGAPDVVYPVASSGGSPMMLYHFIAHMHPWLHSIYSDSLCPTDLMILLVVCHGLFPVLHNQKSGSIG